MAQGEIVDAGFVGIAIGHALGTVAHILQMVGVVGYALPLRRMDGDMSAIGARGMPQIVHLIGGIVVTSRKIELCPGRHAREVVAHTANACIGRCAQPKFIIGNPVHHGTTVGYMPRDGYACGWRLFNHKGGAVCGINFRYACVGIVGHLAIATAQQHDGNCYGRH